MASLKDFVVRINARGRKVEELTNKMVKRCALGIDQAVVLGTPVDTGRARSNWLASLGSGRSDEIEPYSPIPKGTDASKKGEGSNAQAAILQARGVIERRQPEQTIYLSNNVDYIGDLNRGSSPQADPGYVQAAVQVGVDIIRTSKVVD